MTPLTEILRGLALSRIVAWCLVLGWLVLLFGPERVAGWIESAGSAMLGVITI